MRIQPMFGRALVVFVFTVLLTSPGAVSPARAAGPWYVVPGGNDGNSCLSPAAPCATIHGAIAKASSGDTIKVAIGTYLEAVSLSSITLLGGWDAAFTTQTGASTIDCQGAGTCVSVPVQVVGAVMEHFMVQNGSSGWGGGIANQGGLSLSNSTIVENKASTGGGIVNSGSLSLSNSLVSGNAAEFCGGIDNSGTLVITESTITGNKGAPGNGGGICISSGATVTVNRSVVDGNTGGFSGGGIYNNGLLTINHSSISNNRSLSAPTWGPGGGGINNRGVIKANNVTVGDNVSAGLGGGILNSGELGLSNCTVARNIGVWGGGIYTENDAVSLRNTLVSTNNAENGPDCMGNEAGRLRSTGYNIIGNSTGCNFDSEPSDKTGVAAAIGQLIGIPRAPKYYPLLSGSPAIDAGDPAGCMGSDGLLTTDQRGVSRVGRCDIGAYEYTTPGPPSAFLALAGTPQRTVPGTAFQASLRTVVMDSVGSPVSGVIVTYTAPVSGPSGIFSNTGSNATTATTDDSGVATAASFEGNLLSGSYMVSGTTGGIGTSAPFLLTNFAWYVAPGGNDANDCFSPAAPCATINGALGKPGLAAGDTVCVAVGTYAGVGDEVVLLDKSVVLSGGWNSAFTTHDDMSTIDGGGIRRAMTVRSADASVKRFVFRNGSAGFGSGIFLDGATLLLDGSAVIGNKGDGIYAGGDLVLMNSAITGNGGGGLYGWSGTVSLVNATISGNKSGGINFGGGGGTLNISSSTITENEGGKGLAWGYGWSAVKNSIIAGNISLEGNPDCATDTPLRSFGYNLIGNSTGCNLIWGPGELKDMDARLGLLIGLPGYHPLLPDSPALDGGNPAGCTDHRCRVLTTDQRGAPRAGRCDIGAYEYASAGPATTIVILEGSNQSTAPNTLFDLLFKVRVLDAVGTPVAQEKVTFTGPSTGASGTFIGTDTSSTTASTDANGTAVAAPWKANGITGSYIVTATAGGVPKAAEFKLTNSSPWYVTVTGSDGNTCRSISRPCATVNGVLAKSTFVPGDTILVGAGSYTGAGDQVVMLWKNARLLGGWDATFTAQTALSILDGQDVRRGVTVEAGANAVMERFSIVHGRSTGQGYGGAVLNGGALTLRGSVVTENRAETYGGGIFNGGTLVLRDTAVNDNISGETAGGGIYSGGPLALVNCTVSGNKADDCGPFCGSPIAILTGGSTQIANSTIAGNAGSGLASLGATLVQNSILAGNPAGDCGGTLQSLGYNLVGSHTDCAFNSALGDRVNADPQIAPAGDYFVLLRGSPAINAGRPDGCRDDLDNPLLNDQRGEPRAGRCDIGAYEVQPLEFSTKVASRTALHPLEPVGYTVTLSNIETFDIAGVDMTDTLPAQLTYTGGSLAATSGNASYADGAITWAGTINSGQSVVITFGAHVGLQPGPIVNSAIISGGGDALTRTATVVVRLPHYLPMVLKN